MEARAAEVGNGRMPEFCATPFGSVLILLPPGSLPPYGKVSGPGDLDLGYCLRSERSTMFTDGGYKQPW